MLLLSTLRLLVPLAVGTIIGALVLHTIGGIVGATVGIILGLIWASRALLAEPAGTPAKITPPQV